MNNAEKKLELILAYLLRGPETDDEALKRRLEELAKDPAMETLLERVETLFSEWDDPDWLEAIAAASEGSITPEIEDFLQDKEILKQLEPELVEQFEALRVRAPEDLDLLPAYPSFAEQFQAKKKHMSSKIDASIWHQAEGLRWQQIKERGQVMIQVLADALNQALPLSTSLPAYAGGRRSGKGRLQFELKNAIEDLEVEITAEAKRGKSNTYTVMVKVDIPSRGGWPHLAGTAVTVKQGDQKIETQFTDSHGNVIFEKLEREQLSQLIFEITSS